MSNAHTQSDLAEIPENNQGERRGSAAGSEDRESINDYIESTQRMAQKNALKQQQEQKELCGERLGHKIEKMVDHYKTTEERLSNKDNFHSA